MADVNQGQVIIINNGNNILLSAGNERNERACYEWRRSDKPSVEARVSMGY